MRQKLKWDERIGIILLAVSFGLLGISVYLSFSSDIWYDELFTMGLADQPLGELISITARDVHPPLYYLIVKLFLNFSGAVEGSIAAQVTAAKLVSVLPFFLCLLYIITKVRKNFGMFAAGLFGFLLVTMPQMADYTVEVRMYGYALFFVTAGMLHAYELANPGDEEGEVPVRLKDAVRACKRKSYVNWIWLTICSLAACYTHYFACVAACMIYVYLFFVFVANHKIKKEIKPYLASSLCCAAGYLPWVITVVTRQISQVKGSYWIQPLSLRTLGGCIKFLFKPFFSNEKLNVVFAVWLFAVYSLLMISMLTEVIKAKNKAESSSLQSGKEAFITGCVCVLAGLVAFGFLASFLIRPIFVYRYMLPAMGVFWLAFALLVSRLRNRKLLLSALLLLLVITGVRNYRAFYGEEMWKKLQMEEATEALSQIEKGDIVIFNFDQMQAVASYYLNNESYLWYGEPEPLIQEMYPRIHGLVEGEFSDEKGIEALQKLLKENDRIWFIGSGNARDEIIKKWKNAGIDAQETASVMIERYWFNIYKLAL